MNSPSDLPTLRSDGSATRSRLTLHDEYTVVTVTDLLSKLADVTDRGLYVDDEFVTWSEHLRRSAQRAAAVTDLLTDGRPPHVGVLMSNVAEFSYLIAAAALGEFVVVGLNTTRRGAALAADIATADCDLVLTCSDTRHLLADVDVGEEVPGVGAGEDQIAVGGGDIGGEGGATAGGVEADDDELAERRRSDQIAELGDVAHQHADVGRSAVGQQVGDSGCALRGASQMLTPRNEFVVDVKSAVGDVGQLRQEIGDGHDGIFVMQGQPRARRRAVGAKCWQIRG